jgi:uncharacterized membrane protein YccC
VRLFYFDFNINLPNVPQLDFRAQFLLVAVAIPILFSVIMLLFFQPVLVCIWYLLTVASLATLIGGCIVYFLPKVAAATGLNVSAKILLICGAVGTAICIVLALIMWGRRNRKVASEVEEAEEEYHTSLKLYKDINSPPRGKKLKFLKNTTHFFFIF